MHDALGILDRVGHPRLLVIGDLMLDRYVWGNAGRISPEAPVPVLCSDYDEVRLGGAASVAYLLRGLEVEVTLAGIVGQDADGRTIRRLLDEAGINHSLVIEDGLRISTRKERIIGRSASGRGHQLVRVDREDDREINRQQQDALLASIVGRLPEHDAILIADYRKGVCAGHLLRELLRAAADVRMPVLVDPAHGGDFARYRAASMLKPNRLEAQIATGMTIRRAEDALPVGRLLCQQSRVPCVVITLDAEGMALVLAGGKGQLVTTRSRNVHDVTGAGDMALAMLGICRASRMKWPEAVCLANVAAGLEVERFGVAQISREEVYKDIAACDAETASDCTKAASSCQSEDTISMFHYDSLARSTDHCERVLTLDWLLRRLAAHRRAGQSIVFTNGCFDLLHVGHVHCLQEAASMGDVLVVAVNSDESVRRLKGTGRPVVKDKDRATMVAALECVDYVTIFDADTPNELLVAIRPNVLVKGGSYQEEAVEGREIVEAQGGEVRITGRVRGTSTTRILGRIQRRIAAS